MIIKKIFVISLLSIATIASASSMRNDCYIFEKNPHNIYFGPHFLGFQLDTTVDNIQVEGTRFLWGFEIGYEYLKPRSFYLGIDLYAVSTDADFTASINNVSPSWNQGAKVLGNIELRGGYTFALQQWLITPYLGLGIYDLFNLDDTNNEDGFSEDLPYVTIGAHTDYQCSSYFKIGLNLNIFKTFCAQQKFTLSSSEAVEHNNFWGGEVGIPFTWYFGACRKWSLQFEPYYSSLSFCETQNIYGARFLAGYRF